MRGFCCRFQLFFMVMEKDCVLSLNSVSDNFEKEVKCLRYNKVYYRRRPCDFQDAQSESQRLQRARMNAVVAFYRNVRPTLVGEAWQREAYRQHRSRYNLFVSVNINAFNQEGGVTDYSKLVLSKGELQLPDNVSVQAEGKAIATVCWRDNSRQQTAWGCDLMEAVVIYDHAPFEVFRVTPGNVTRKDCGCVIPLAIQEGEGAHLYVFFRRKDSLVFSSQRYFCLTF